MDPTYYQRPARNQVIGLHRSRPSLVKVSGCNRLLPVYGYTRDWQRLVRVGTQNARKTADGTRSSVMQLVTIMRLIKVGPVGFEPTTYGL